MTHLHPHADPDLERLYTQDWHDNLPATTADHNFGTNNTPETRSTLSSQGDAAAVNAERDPANGVGRPLPPPNLEPDESGMFERVAQVAEDLRAIAPLLPARMSLEAVRLAAKLDSDWGR
jgi:hypothetical protein